MIPAVEMDVDACFAASYADARGRFLARTDGAVRKSYANPQAGPEGEPLAADAAWFGPADAANVLVLVSATHGVEGFCGAGAQLDVLWTGLQERLPAGTALLLVHAINPYGFAWLRRTTEEGVDLNRNCVDFSKPVPANEGYAELADAFVPRALAGPEFEAAVGRLAAWREAHGATAYENARSGGQHVDPNGIFYGGAGPTWALRTIEAVAADFDLAGRRSVAVIDYHTGLGPFGYGEPICGHRPGESGQARCRAWYGDSLGEPMLGTSSSLVIAGLTQYAWARLVGPEKLTFVALEYGTYGREVTAETLRAEHWLHAHGKPDWASGETRRIKAAFKRSYFPDTRDWKEMVLLRSRQVVDQALTGLSS